MIVANTGKIRCNNLFIDEVPPVAVGPDYHKSRKRHEPDHDTRLEHADEIAERPKT
jgi:hypothetical protein